MRAERCLLAVGVAIGTERRAVGPDVGCRQLRATQHDGVRGELVPGDRIEAMAAFKEWFRVTTDQLTENFLELLNQR
ncbi:hypothetical protein ACFY0R_01545 [Streptomyces sp. NPDC001633]|uniref:hypothetical protein n=1 Tax=Streptomyces sp. NPDC001633 TaxID=3364595 RepID=UPI0036A7C64F